jgi:hypothetical protein
MLPISPCFRSCLIPSGCEESELKIELMTTSSDHHVFMRITTSRRREGLAIAHGNGYLQSHRLMIPASNAPGMFSGNKTFRIFRAFFSPIGRVLGKMGELVVDVFSTCSSSRLQRQFMMAVKVGTSASREQIEVRVTV